MSNGWDCCRVKYEGKIFKTSKNGDLIVLEYFNHKEVKVKFLDTGNISIVKASDLRKGKAKDRSIASILNHGIVGSDFLDAGFSSTREYTYWYAMLQRCYSDKYQQKGVTYKGCSMSENFKYFPFFMEWCNKQIGFDQESWQLDKDILVKGNKIYSEDTCCFVPAEINSVFIKCDRSRGEYPLGVNYHKATRKFVAQISYRKIKTHLGLYDTAEDAFKAYKKSKEKLIKSLADKYMDVLDPRVYKAMVEYEVEIGD